MDTKDLLSFIESELDPKNLVDDYDYSSSDDEGNETQDKSKDSFNQNNKLEPRKSLKKKFFNIELKLRAFIKEQQIAEEFKSFLIKKDLKLQ